MNTFQIALMVNYILCFLAILGMLFLERKKPIRFFVWILVLAIPFLGLLIYLLIGYGLGIKTKILLKRRKLNNKRYNIYLKKQKKDFENIDSKFKDLILMNLNNANSIYFDDNKIDYFNDGAEMLESLKLDLLKAEKTINTINAIKSFFPNFNSLNFVRLFPPL